MTVTGPPRARPDPVGRSARPAWRRLLSRLVPRSPRQRRLAALALAAAVVCTPPGLWLWWDWRADRDLRLTIDALRARGQPVTLEDFQPSRLPARNNAAVLLRQAILQARQRAQADELLDAYDFRPSRIRRHGAHVARLLAALAPVFDAVKRTRGMKRCQWLPQWKHPAISTDFSYAIDARTLAGLLAIRAIAQADRGDHAGAITTIEDMLKLGEWVRDEPPSRFGNIIGTKIAQRALEVLEAILPQLQVAPPAAAGSGVRPVSRDALRQLGTRLLDDRPSLWHYQRAIWAERMMYLDLATDVVRRMVWIRPGQPALQRMPALALAMRPIFRRDIVDGLKYYTAVADAAAQPTFPKALRVLPQFQEWLGPFEEVVHQINVFLLGYAGTTWERYEELAVRRLAAVAIALRLYELDHGRRPGRLDALVPEYLVSVPTDPFSDPPGPLRYAPGNDPPVIYSVSGNGQDDGGRFAVYGLGIVNVHRYDLVWFLDGNRPQAKPRRKPNDPNTPVASHPTRRPGDGAETHRIEDAPR